jgi:muramidase (phage lysozyme)
MNGLLILFLLAALPSAARSQAFDQLLRSYGGAEAAVPMLPAAPEPESGFKDAEQFLPPNNDNPGFEWQDEHKTLDHFFYIGNNTTFLKSGPYQADGLADGTGKCVLEPNTAYKAAAKPGFEGEHMTVQLAEKLPGCSLSSGYVYMTHVSSSSAGGIWELPRNVRAFLDTIAFAEGTRERYNYVFTFATFNSYADHPRIKKCAGKLCSTAAGRYQFLSKTWDPLARELGLPDFTPPNQEKATLEIIRRAGAYNNVAKASVYENFTAALGKLNTTWASLPGSPYGQPTHPTAELWRYFKGRLALY